MAELSPTAQSLLFAHASGLAYNRRIAIAAVLRAAAYTIDWESGDPKFLLENVAAELESQ